MERDHVLRSLRANEAELRAFGVAQLSLFGSVARGEAGELSDVDVAAVFDPAAKVDLFKFAALGLRLEGMIGRRVDLLGKPARNAAMRLEIERDRVRVF